MKILQINTVYGEGSTGAIAKSIHDACIRDGIECLVAHRCVKTGSTPIEGSLQISSKWDSRIHGWFSQLTMFKGMGSYTKTKAFIRKVKEYSPDLIHLHNLHGSYINIHLLFKYIKENDIPVVWTLHDCWAFTAICSHFVLSNCDRWNNGCGACPQRKRFSKCPIDMTKHVWNAKKKWFSGVNKLTVVTPSNWLNSLVCRSFLGQYPTKTIYNGIDLQVFSKTKSNFREKWNLLDKKVVLGVAFDWGYGKGLDVFVELSKSLGDDYKIVLVGTNDSVDKHLPNNILSIHRTQDKKDLAAIYSAADVFVNPTREEVLGLVNIEALACETPVITFNTGGSPECIDDSCGVIVDVNDVDSLKREIIRVCANAPFEKESCRTRSQMFDNDKYVENYIDLYKKILKS